MQSEEQEREEEPKLTKSHQRAQFQTSMMAVRVQREKFNTEFNSKEVRKCAMFFEGTRMS